MTTYIYFVKCPGCEDEHFDFFKDAEAYALGKLSERPIITQTEVNRNDFGECTDSYDLGTVWSWEDVMKDTEGGYTEAEPVKTLFTKDDLKLMADGQDPEFDNLDNSVDCEPKLTEAATTAFIDLGDGCKMSREAIYDEIAVNKNDIDIPVGDLGLTHVSFNDGGRYSDTTLNVSMDKGIFYITEWHQSDDGDLTEGDSFEFRTFEEFWNKLTSYVDVELEECTRKPVPEGMTIDQLKEAMEENEDTVECAGCEELFPKEDCFHKDGIGWLCGDCEDRIVRCTWCEELFDRSECRREVDLGWLCSRCEMGIKSRGETLTFREGSYWDDLDEDTDGLNEASKLTEAKYDFKNLQIGNDKLTPEELTAAKDKIKDELIARDPSYYVDNNLTMSVLYSANDKIRITDFTFDQGHIKLLVTRTNTLWTGTGDRTPVDTYLEWDLKDATAEVKDIRYSRSLNANAVARPLQFIKDLTEIATEVNKSFNLGTAERRNRRVATMVSNLEPEVAEELKKQISDIKFVIPADGYFWQDIQDIDPLADEDTCKQAVEVLTSLRDNFFALNLQDVNYEERYVPATEKAFGIITSWGAEGIISFKCSIGELSKEAQALIKDTKFIKKRAEPKPEKVPETEEEKKEQEKKKAEKERLALSARHTNNYRLAVALCQYFGNDGKFYEKTTTESLESRNVLAFCPECGVDDAFDHAAGFCTSCGYKH